MGTSMKVSLKTINRVLIQSAILLLGMHPENTIIWKVMHPSAHNSTIYSSQDMKAT